MNDKKEKYFAVGYRFDEMVWTKHDSYQDALDMLKHSTESEPWFSEILIFSNDTKALVWCKESLEKEESEEELKKFISNCPEIKL